MLNTDHRQTENDSAVQTIRVVMVDDYTLTRAGLRALLTRHPRIDVVGEAETAEVGLQMVEQHKPDVVLMDLGLPGMNGIQATRQIKALSPKTHVIILTSHGQQEEVLDAMRAGARAYCLKDIESERLLQVVEDVAQGAAWFDPMVASSALEAVSSGSYTSQPGRKLPIGSSSHAPLTDREREVLRLVVDGKSNTEIADDLTVSTHTVKTHVCNILQKLYVTDRVQAAVKAVREGIV